MILRIDDTDIERNTSKSLQSIYDGLCWLELEWDEQYRQSERLDLHRREAWRIFERGLAYRDFTPASGEEPAGDHSKGPWLANPGMREMPQEESDRRAGTGERFVLRYRVPRRTSRVIKVAVPVYAEQAESADDVEDFALLRSNAMPTYHMASCADDTHLRISHIIRGQDHLSNAFKHILIFEALGVRPPAFAHLPLLIAPDSSKLSKRRHGAVVSVTTYRDAGFLPHAYVNFLCLLGWSPKDNREQMSREELIGAFSLAGVNRANAVVNFTAQDPIDSKALWLNSQHLRSMPVDDLLPRVRAVLEGHGLKPQEPESRFRQTVKVIRSRYATLLDFPTKGRAYFADDFPMQPEALKKLEVPQARDLLRELGRRLAASTEFTEPAVEAALRALAAEKGVKAGVLINGARAALTGQTVGPSAFAVFMAVGRDRVLGRLRGV
jgi:glutamyl-tRNA synthetase